MKNGGKTKKELLQELAGMQMQINELQSKTCEREGPDKSLRESLDRYRLLAENAQDFIYRIRILPVVKYEYVSPSVTTINGYAPEDFYNDPDLGRKIVHPDDRRLFEEMASPEFTEGKPYVMRWVHKDGRIIWTESRNSVILDDIGRFVAVEGIARDVTESKQAENALKESEAKYRAYFENSIDGVLLTSPDGKVYSANATACRIFGMTEEELIKAGRNGLVDLTDPRLDAALEERAHTGRFKGELSFRRKDGVIFPAELSTSVFRDRNGDVRTFMIIRDITERKKAEITIEESEEKFRTLVENAPVGIAISKPDGTPVVRNIGAVKMHGYESKEEFMKLNARELYYDFRDRERFLALLSKGPVKDFEVRRKRKDGSLFWASLTAIPVPTQSGEEQLIVVIQDITQRKQAEDALKASEEKFKALFENAPVGIGITTATGKRILRNAAQLRIFGYDSREEMLAAPVISRYVNLEDRKRYLKLLNKGTVQAFEVEMKRKNNSKFWASLSAAPYSTVSGETHFITVIQDITERKKTEEALRSSQQRLQTLTIRLEVIREEEKAVLAREIHDEFGQALTALKMDMFWLAGRMPDSQKMAAEKLASMLHIVNDLLARVKQISTDLRPAMLDDFGLRETIEWASQEFEARSGIKVFVETSGDNIPLDKAKTTAAFRIFQEAFTNIARHAGASAVRVKMKTTANVFSLSIRDDGRGITADELKDPHSLGLIGMRERANFLGGKILIKGVPGKGTSVNITIPLSEVSHD